MNIMNMSLDTIVKALDEDEKSRQETEFIPEQYLEINWKKIF